MQDKKQQLEPDMEQWTGSKLGKEHVKAVYCHPVCLTYMQSTSCKMPGWMTHKPGSRLPRGNINSLRYADDTSLTAESEEELKNLLMRMKEESENASLKLNIKKQRSWHLVPSLHGKLMRKKWKQWQILFSWAPKSLQTVTEATKLEVACSLKGKLWQT